MEGHLRYLIDNKKRNNLQIIVITEGREKKGKGSGKFLQTLEGDVLLCYKCEHSSLPNYDQ